MDINVEILKRVVLDYLDSSILNCFVFYSYLCDKMLSSLYLKFQTTFFSSSIYRLRRD